MPTDEASTRASDDIFSSLLNLEEQYHAEGYALGCADGAQSGRVEGRVFGLEKGLEKFLEMGRLRGRAAVWQTQADSDSSTLNERLRRQLDRLVTLTDPETFTTENSEDAVAEVDDRLKDAKGKERIVKRLLGEKDDVFVGEDQLPLPEAQQKPATNTQTLRIKRTVANTTVRNTTAGTRVGSGEMEDFIGLPGTTKKTG